MAEIWKELEFTDNKYLISNYGRLKRLNLVPYENKPSKEGYVRFTFNSKPYNVHRLVAELFCEKEEGMDIVDHINGLRNDNRAENLRWTNHSGNNRNRVYGRDIIKPKTVMNNTNELGFVVSALAFTTSKYSEQITVNLKEEIEYYKTKIKESEEKNALLTKHLFETTNKLLDNIVQQQILLLNNQ